MSLTSAIEGPRSFAPGPRRSSTLAGSSGERTKGSEEWHSAGATIEEEGAQSRPMRVVLSGWAGCCRTLSDGRRQILHLLVPGDLCSLLSLTPGPSLCSTVALTPVRTVSFGSIDKAPHSEAAQHGVLAHLAARQAARQQEALLAHAVRLGRLSALERTAHLLLDLHGRLDAVELAQGETISLPLTQDVLADTLGLSIVHMNRTLQHLRRVGLIRYRAGRLTIMDRRSLAQTCGYEGGPVRRVARSRLVRSDVQRTQAPPPAP